MLTTRILPVLLAVVLVVVVIGYMTGTIGMGSNANLPFDPSSTPVPTATSDIASPDATESSTPAATPTWETIPISSQINEVVTPTSAATPVTAVPTVSSTAAAYFVHMDDTMMYNTATSRMFEVNIDHVPFIVYFSFNPGTVKKSYVAKDSTSSNTVRYEVWNPSTGKYETRSQVESRYVVKSTDVIDPNAWFKVDIIRIYDDADAYDTAVSAAGGKEKLAEKKLLYEDNGIIVKQDGYARGYSSEVEKELKLLSPGKYLVKVTGNQIVVNIQMLSP
ncbi:MAG: hypothetical protein O0V67_01355 [Methanocorpusculum sp.]|nr:hypothetical protein [Methanocorpusculum sp.]